MSIMLVATLCHALAGVPAVCVEEPIPQTEIERMAGKIDAPLPMGELRMLECKAKANERFVSWLGKHPDYFAWDLASLKCEPDYVPKGKA